MTRDEAIELCMKEASMMTEVEASERRLNWAREMIKNRGKKQAVKQAGKRVMNQAMKQAMKQTMMNWDE